MKWKNLMKVAFKSIMKNRMRSLLTMLGIIIGVGAVIALVSIGQGTQAEVENQIELRAESSPAPGQGQIHRWSRWVGRMTRGVSRNRNHFCAGKSRLDTRVKPSTKIPSCAGDKYSSHGLRFFHLRQ